jgi:chemotaxis-related protein WspD
MTDDWNAAELLDGLPPDDYIAQWTAHFAQPVQTAEREMRTALLFRIGAEWFALPAAVIDEIAGMTPIHSIPHRRRRAVIGITNVRGELLACVSLAVVLSVPAAPPDARGTARLLVLRRDDVHAVCPVDETGGIIRFDAHALIDIPGTLAHASSRYSKHLLPWEGRSVGVLDDQLLFSTLGRSLAA